MREKKTVFGVFRALRYCFLVTYRNLSETAPLAY